MTSTAPESAQAAEVAPGPIDRFRAWVAREEDERPLTLFRRAFAGIWLAYDVCDLGFHGTASCADWLGTLQHGPPQGMVVAQVGLVVCQLLLLLGFGIPLAALGALAFRTYEAFGFFRLNDFLYYIVIASYLVFSAPEKGKVSTWVRDALLIQTGWIYLATALMKSNPAFLSGGHFYVRHEYLLISQWPYPASLRHVLESLPVNQFLSYFTVLAEALLGLLLIARRGFPLAAFLVLGIHVFAAVAVNVWFFGASMIAQVLLLFPRTPAPAAKAP